MRGATVLYFLDDCASHAGQILTMENTITFFFTIPMANTLCGFSTFIYIILGQKVTQSKIDFYYYFDSHPESLWKKNTELFLSSM